MNGTNEWMKCTSKNKLKMNEHSISWSRCKKVERSVINYCNIYSDSFLIFDVLQTELSITVDDMIKNNLSNKTVRSSWIFFRFFSKLSWFHSFLFVSKTRKPMPSSINVRMQSISIHLFSVPRKKKKKCNIHWNFASTSHREHISYLIRESKSTFCVEDIFTVILLAIINISIISTRI